MMKKLVVLCDGTWNTPEQAISGTPCPTNVTKLAIALADRDDDGREQRACYRPGVGNRLGERLRGGAFGYGLSREVQAVYTFLVENFEPGDLLYFVGFSRGAYTARSTVGLVRKAGILRPEHADRVGDAYALYRDRKVHPTDAASEEFRRAYSYETRVRFLGVWDTVGALGIPWSGQWLVDLFNSRWRFHDTDLSTRVDAAFQALAIDERRRPFEPAIWNQRPDAAGQRLEQVWFAGDHCDVGGGHPDARLSDLPLLWMLQKARECGLAFDPPGEWVASAHEFVSRSRWSGEVDPDPRGPLHTSRAWLYRLFRQHLERPLGRAHRGEEYVATTAVQRRNDDPGYRPRELEAYLSGPHRVMEVPVRQE
jgi:uncharacterized protein (DUF2235 family)